MIRQIVLITNPTIPKYKTELIQVQMALMHWLNLTLQRIHLYHQVFERYLILDEYIFTYRNEPY